MKEQVTQDLHNVEQELQDQQQPPQPQQQEGIQIDFQTKMQLDFGIINTKLQLLNISKDMIREKVTSEQHVMNLYYKLREEVLGHSNPNTPEKQM